MIFSSFGSILKFLKKFLYESTSGSVPKYKFIKFSLLLNIVSLYALNFNVLNLSTPIKPPHTCGSISFELPIVTLIKLLFDNNSDDNFFIFTLCLTFNLFIKSSTIVILSEEFTSTVTISFNKV